MQRAENIEFNIPAMTTEESKQLHQFLCAAYQQNKQSIFPAGLNEIFLNGEMISFDLSHALIRRDCVGHKNDYRFEVLEKNLSTTTSLQTNIKNDFYQGLGTLKPQRHIDAALHFKKQAYFIKVQDCTDADDEYFNLLSNGARQAYVIARIFPHLHFKPILVEGRLIVSIMRYFVGEDLFSVLKQDVMQHTPLTLDERLNLTLMVLYALYKLHLLKIQHRDVKPENIMIFQGKQGFKAEMIDFEYSRFTFLPHDRLSPGTPRYAAPEVCSDPGATNELTDVYAMGKSIKILWRKGVDLEDLSESQYQSILLVLTQMTMNNQNDRCNLVLPIVTFEKILLERKLEKFEPSLHQQLKEAFLAAKSVIELFYQINIRDLLASFEPFMRTVETRIASFDESPESMSIFIEFLNISYFDGVQSKREFIEKLNLVIAQYSEANSKIAAVYDRVKNLGELIAERGDQSNTTALKDVVSDTLYRAEVKKRMWFKGDFSKVSYASFFTIRKMTKKFNKEVTRAESRLSALEDKINSAIIPKPAKRNIRSSGKRAYPLADWTNQQSFNSPKLSKDGSIKKEKSPGEPAPKKPRPDTIQEQLAPEASASASASYRPGCK